jgi:hypothetical protein
MKTAKATIRLRNTITGLFYVSGACFSANVEDATIIERNSPDHVMIRHTFAMDYVEEVEVNNPEDNKHINGTTKRRAIPSRRWDKKSYVFGDWHIDCEQYNQNKGAHAYLKSTRPNYVPMWSAHNPTTGETIANKCGGIKIAEKSIIRHEMKRYGFI